MIMTKLMKKRDKIRAQMKSRFYYMFWGAATIAVVTGQILVGTGYRRMAQSNEGISADINLLVEVLTVPETYIPRGRGLYEPLIPPPTGDFNRDQIDLTEIDPDDYIIWLETPDEEV